jgi:protein-disulfide isomerase
MHRRYYFPSLIGSLLLLTACSVNMTGIATESNRTPHPKSNINAAILVTEFIDLQCESCRAAQTMIVKPMLAQYGSQIRYEVKHFPIYPSHQYSKEAAEAAECAADQGKFWGFEEMNYEKQDDLSPKAISKWATDLGLDMDLFERCRKSNIKMMIVEASQEEGKKLGVNGTPTFFVNGKKVGSTMSAIGDAIQQALSGSTLMPL